MNIAIPELAECKEFVKSGNDPAFLKLWERLIRYDRKENQQEKRRRQWIIRKN